MLTEEDRTSLKSLLPRATGDPQPDSEIQTLKLVGLNPFTLKVQYSRLLYNIH